MTDLPIAGATLAELREHDIGSWKNPRYAGERIPTLHEVLGTIPAGKRIFMEIKCGPEIIPVIKNQLEAFPRVKPEQISIICFQEKIIKTCREQLPDIATNWLTSFKRSRITGKWSPSPASVLQALLRTGASGLGAQAHSKVMTPAFVKAVHQAQYGFHCWTVDEAALAKHLQSIGVDSITTNRPDFIRKVLSRDTKKNG